MSIIRQREELKTFLSMLSAMTNNSLRVDLLIYVRYLVDNFLLDKSTKRLSNA